MHTGSRFYVQLSFDDSWFGDIVLKKAPAFSEGVDNCALGTFVELWGFFNGTALQKVLQKQENFSTQPTYRWAKISLES